ncbi:MAG: 50S ribosomal protein L10 [Chloroflexi bacterium]|nr:MAG: 50S ribosomal protein L10 [Chloroflexota bacterium]
MAITKERKREIINDYSQWMKNSRALIITEYKGLPMKELDTLRARMRENGGEYHVVKNTLGKLAFEQAGLKMPEGLFEGTTAIGFAFEDAPSVAKMISEYARTSDFLKIKGGYLGDRVITAQDVKDLAELPPLPVMRARILGVIMAPASQIARTIAEPARMIAAVVKAYVDKENAPAETAA